jgi:glycerol-1-phosphate dehydrogenase [NAD(P)+]
VQETRLVLLTDENTKRAAGAALGNLLEGEGFSVTPLVLAPAAPGGKVLADEKSLGRLITGAPENTRALVSCGGGTLTDLARYAAHRLGLPAACFATAPSMDGFLSSVAPLISGGRKITFPASPPLLVGADPVVLEGAPLKLKAAGFADLLGKMTSRLDWELAAEYRGETVCEAAEALIFDRLGPLLGTVRRTAFRAASAAIYDRAAIYDEAFCSRLFEALAASGTAIAVAGDSRPASGSEHHVSHYLEMKALAGEAPAHYHGETVALGLRISAALYRDFFSGPPDAAAAFGSGEGRIAERAAETLPAAEDLDEILRRGGVLCDPREMGYSPELLRETILNAKNVRPRFTILSFLDEAGLLEKAADRIVDRMYS